MDVPYMYTVRHGLSDRYTCKLHRLTLFNFVGLSGCGTVALLRTKACPKAPEMTIDLGGAVATALVAGKTVGWTVEGGCVTPCETLDGVDGVCQPAPGPVLLACLVQGSFTREVNDDDLRCAYALHKRARRVRASAALVTTEDEQVVDVLALVVHTRPRSGATKRRAAEALDCDSETVMTISAAETLSSMCSASSARVKSSAMSSHGTRDPTVEAAAETLTAIATSR
jgi:hypothetical protein